MSSEEGAAALAGPYHELQCFQRFIDNAIAKVIDFFTVGHRCLLPTDFLDQMREYADNPIQQGYTDEPWPPRCSSEWLLRTFFAIFDDLLAAQVLSHLSDGGYFDSSCNRLDLPAGAPGLCGQVTFGYVPTPISLLWENDSDPNREISFVQFPLRPGAPGRWYTWKASAKTPLLVYDPKRLGAVTSYSQLFGNWTFGGQRQAALSLGAKGASAVPWKNGYDALATLDRDGDNRLTGEELEGLSLWFDLNQNGRADPGEVRPVQEVGLSALSLVPDYTDPQSGDIYIRHGYERMVNGKLQGGATVDWLAREASSQSELILDGLASSQGGGGQAPVEAPAAKAQLLPFVPSPLNGMWRWQVKEKFEGGIPLHGLLTFKAEAQGKLKGHSYLELPLKPNKFRAERQIRGVALSGDYHKLPEGGVEVAFEIEDPAGAHTRTRARLSADEKLLAGVSVSDMPPGSGGAASYKYAWTARRYLGAPAAKGAK